MNKEDLRELLHQEYNPDNWKKVTQYVFPNVSYLQRPQDIPFTNEKVESFKQVGNVKLNDGKNLAMFEVKVSPNVNIANNRVELRKLVTPLIDQERNHGVLVIYEQGKEDYRFTFTAKSTEFDENTGDFVNRETHAKRYTYVLGKNESCKTAANRFYELSNKKEIADINTVQEAFSVEKLSKQFFKEYKEHYQKFVAYLMETASYRDAIFKGDDKAIRDFVKLLLGRLVFIQFVQKKRWMGVPSTSAGWNEGQTNFLYRSFIDFPHRNLFYSQFLEPLFYETLNNPNRPNNIFQITGTKVPYLNGGLFEKGETNTSLVNFPEAYFSDLLEFFDRYNFTINEYDPAEHEVGIDPEMLGHIFENLLEDNKDKGAFYTPKEIVHYMCQESLKEYLKTYLNEKGIAESTELDSALEAFVKRKEAADVIEYDEHLATALRDVKICDPAIGSGAFPMGLLNEIFQCVYVLYSASPDVVGDIWGMNTWAPDVVKKNIIQNSIYGVDIEKGAVDIARLRFWLSLIIDESEPHALPNLDYKIVVGNSLVSKLGDEVVEIDWELNEDSNNLFSAELAKEKVELLKKISQEQKKFFSPNSDKKGLAAHIRNLKIDLIVNQLRLMIEKQNLQHEPKAENYRNKPKAKFTEDFNRYLQTLGWKDNIKKLLVLKNQAHKPLDFFDWKLDFPEVMNASVANKVGFDIVIGNPPYLGEKGNKEKFREIKLGFLKDYYQAKMDIFYFFFHLGIIFSKKNGIITFITTNYYPTADGAVKLRKTLKDEVDVIQLINLNEFKVFDSASGQHNLITILKKSRISSPTKLVLVNRKNQTGSNILRDIFSGVDTETYYSFKKEIFDGENNYIRIASSDEGGAPSSFFKKIVEQSIRLDSLLNINTGCDVAISKITDKHLKSFPENKFCKGDGVFVLNNLELERLLPRLNNYEKTLIKPYIKNSDISQYTYTISNDNLIYIQWDENPHQIPNLIKHLKRFETILKDQVIRYEEPNWPWYALHRPREKSIFESNSKILVPYRSVINAFAISDAPIYSSRDVFFLTKKEQSSVNLFAILSILNSKLLFYWLFNRGKRKGVTLELYNTPLSEIPVSNSLMVHSSSFALLSKEVIKQKSDNKDTTALEKQIDNLVYRLYDLSYEEVKIVDPEFGLSEEEYNNIKIE